MTTNIALVAPMTGRPDSRRGRELVESLFLRNANKLKEPATRVDYHLLRHGFSSSDDLCWEPFNVWNNYELFEAVRRLEDRYDAVVLHCYSDPHLDALRQIMDIPVVGVVQTSLAMAVTMAPKFGVVTFCTPFIPIIDELVVRYGHERRAVPTVSTDTTQDAFRQGYEDAHGLIEAFQHASRRSIQAGAEALVPG
jgi:hypothetical protein